MPRKIIIGLLAVLVAGLGTFAYMQANKRPSSAMPLTPKGVSPIETSQVADPDAREPAEASPSPPPDLKSPAQAAEKKAGTGHFEIYVPYADQAANDLASSMDDLSKSVREKKLRAAFAAKDQVAAKYVKINSLSCRETICTIDAEAKNNATGLQFQNAIVEVLRHEPWIGNMIDITTPIDDPRRGRFVFYREMPK